MAKKHASLTQLLIDETLESSKIQCIEKWQQVSAKLNVALSVTFWGEKWRQAILFIIKRSGIW